MNSRTSDSRSKPARSCLRLGGTMCAAILAVVVAGCSRPTASEQAGTPAEAAPVPVTVAPVETRSVQRHVSVVGTLHGFERITVTPKVEGRVDDIQYDVGDRVSPNAVLLQLDPVDFQLAVNESQRALEHELARLDLTEVPGSEFDIEQLPDVHRSTLLVENAQRQFDRQKTLMANGVGVKENYDQATTDLKVAEAGLRQARIEARTNLASVRQREAMLKAAQQKLSETVVKSPILPATTPEHAAQFVVSRRMTAVGEMVRAFPSTPVIELVVDDVLKLHVMVPERYLAQVTLDLDVEVRVEAYPDEVFPGKVARISPVIDPQSRSFDVEAHIPNRDHRLKHGGFAKADVIIGKADDAITIPLESVTRFAGVSKVFTIRDEQAQEVEIAIGTQGPGWVEALGGLHSGDVVVTSGQSKLANGVRVAVRSEPARTARRE